MRIKNRRKQVLIHDLQYRMLAVNLAYFTSILLVFALVLLGPLVYQLSQPDLSEASRQMVGTQFLLLNQRLWPALLIAFLCLAAHSIYVTHRIGGPLVQFRNAIKRLADGDLTTRVRLRQGDYLAAEADAFNDMRGSLGASLLDTQRQLHELCLEAQHAQDQRSRWRGASGRRLPLAARGSDRAHAAHPLQVPNRGRPRGFGRSAGDRRRRRRELREAVSGQTRQLGVFCLSGCFS